MLKLNPTNKKDKRGKDVYYLESSLNDLEGVLILLSPPDNLNQFPDEKIIEAYTEIWCPGLMDRISSRIQAGQTVIDFKRVNDSIKSVPVVNEFSKRIGLEHITESAFLINQIIFVGAIDPGHVQLILFFKEHGNSPQNYILSQDSSLDIS